jgi:mannose-6-phosphate isomerase-like protein (cupin superfamily)
MIIKRRAIHTKNGRTPYELEGREITVRHFVTRVTTPDNPFKAHQHENAELWFIIAGHALVELDGTEHAVEDGDLIVIDPWVSHGLRTATQVTWICVG